MKCKGIQEEGKHLISQHKFNQKIARDVVRTGEIIYNNGISKTDFSAKNIYDIDTDVVSLCLPIKLRSQCRGVIEVGFKQPQWLRNELQRNT